MKRNIRKVFFKPQLTLSGQYFLDYLKKKRAGEIDETNYNAYYEQDFNNITKTVATRLCGPEYVLTDEDKVSLLDELIKELTRVKEAQEQDEEM